MYFCLSTLRSLWRSYYTPAQRLTRSTCWFDQNEENLPYFKRVGFVFAENYDEAMARCDKMIDAAYHAEREQMEKRYAYSRGLRLVNWWVVSTVLLDTDMQEIK